jgi:hypothetical protein
MSSARTGRIRGISDVCRARSVTGPHQPTSSYQRRMVIRATRAAVSAESNMSKWVSSVIKLERVSRMGRALAMVRERKGARELRGYSHAPSGPRQLLLRRRGRKDASRKNITEGPPGHQGGPSLRANLLTARPFARP